MAKKYRVMLFGQLEMWEVIADDEADALKKLVPPPADGFRKLLPAEVMQEIGRRRILAAVVPDGNAKPSTTRIFDAKTGYQSEMGCVIGTRRARPEKRHSKLLMGGPMVPDPDED